MSPPRTSPGRSRQQGAKVGATRSGSNGSPRSPRTPRSSCSPFRTGAAPASALPRVGAHGREKRGLDESGQGNGANRGAMRRAMPTLGDMVREEAAEDEREKRRHFGKSGLPTWGPCCGDGAANTRGAKGGARAPQNVEEQLRLAIGSIQRTIRRVTASRRGERKRTAS